MTVYVGTSGWSYDHWEPELYPPGLPPRDRLARYTAAQFRTAELNSSFYRWPRPAAFASWRRLLRPGSCCRSRPRAASPTAASSTARSRGSSSWHHDDVLALLEAHGAAYCVMSGAGLPCLLRVTASFAYARLHGPDHQHLYAGSYSDADLRWWADRCREWSDGGRDVFIYFNNDGHAHAVRNARALAALAS